MKVFVKILGVLIGAWLVFMSWASISMFEEVPDQIKRDSLFIAKEIKPVIVTIDSFNAVNKRLPNQNEFRTLEHLGPVELGDKNYIRSDKDADDEIRNYVKGLNWQNEYTLAVWRGEWWEYYISRGQRFVTNDTKLSDRYYIFFYWLFSCAIPLEIFFWIKNKYNNTPSTSA